MSNGGSTPINIDAETLAQFLAKAVSDGTWNDVVEVLKIDDVPSAATDIREDGGQLWSNLQDDMFKLVYAALHKAGKVWRAADLAALQAIGSDSDLTANDLGIATDTGLLYRCTGVTGASTSTWGGLLVGELTATNPGATIKAGNGGGVPNIELDYSGSGNYRWRSSGIVVMDFRGDAASVFLRRYVAGVAQDNPFVVSATTGICTFAHPVTAPNICKFNPSTFTGNRTAVKGERLKFNASGGTFQLSAFASPALGDRWGIKEVGNSSVAVTISGNGANIESPVGATPASTVGASFTVGVPYVSIEWEFDGSVWRII